MLAKNVQIEKGSMLLANFNKRRRHKSANPLGTLQDIIYADLVCMRERQQRLRRSHSSARHSPAWLGSTLALVTSSETNVCVGLFGPQASCRETAQVPDRTENT